MVEGFDVQLGSKGRIDMMTSKANIVVDSTTSTQVISFMPSRRKRPRSPGPSKPHRHHVYRTEKQLLDELVLPERMPRHQISLRYWKKLWRRHREKNGAVPLVLGCSECQQRQKKSDRLIRAKDSLSSPLGIRNDIIDLEQTEVLDRADDHWDESLRDDMWFEDSEVFATDEKEK
jgi:hypothetical protein